jgi:hypothetical protein
MYRPPEVFKHRICRIVSDSAVQMCGKTLCSLATAVLISVPLFSQEIAVPQTHRFQLADCDDLAFGPDGDLYFACHSPHDRLPVEVRGAKATPDEMDAYVLRFNPRTGKLVFATRIAGSSYDGAWRVSVDRRGHA